MIVWQGLFFVGPLAFMVAMSFFLVKNYRMEWAFQFSNWEKTLSRGFFWDAYFLTLWLALLATAVTSLAAFPASYFLAFKVKDNIRRWAVFFLIIPFTRPSIVAALCLTAAVSFDEFAVAWFVSGLNKTVPVVILEILTGNIDPQINAIGTAVFVVIAQVLIMGRAQKPESA